MKRLTTNIARMLAKKVNDRINEKTKEYREALTPKVLASKETKELIKLENELKAMVAKLEDKKKQISDKFSKDGYYVRICIYNDKTSVNVHTSIHSTYEIADMLMLEDHFSDGTNTPEEVVDKMVNKLLNVKS